MKQTIKLIGNPKSSVGNDVMQKLSELATVLLGNGHKVEITGWSYKQ